MTEQKRLFEDIRKLGLNSYEAKIYLALIERESVSVTEASRISGVPRARAYDILDNLVSYGLATLKPGRFKKYGATDPDSFTRSLLSRNEEKYADQKKRIERVSLTLKRKYESTINDKDSRFNPLEYIEIIKNPQQIHKRFMELAGEARQEILIFTKPPYSGPKKKLEEQTRQQGEILRRGIIIKSIYEIPEDKAEIRWWYKDIEAAASHGEQARVIEDLPLKMAVFDEKIVMLPLQDPVVTQTSFTAQVVNHHALAKGLKMLFETVWAQARDYHILENYGDNMQDQ